MDFLQKNTKRFSFKLNGTDFRKKKYTLKVEKGDDEVKYIYTFPDGLKVTNAVKLYKPYGVFEWVNYFENTGDAPSGVISELWDADIFLSLDYEDKRSPGAYIPDPQKATKLFVPCGSDWSRHEFYCDVDDFEESRYKNHIYPGETKSFSCKGGRSSDGTAPFFEVIKNSSGYLLAIGWSGQWTCEFSRTSNGLSFKSKVSDTEFRVMPGETFRTSSVMVMPYQNSTDAHNLWRRLIKEEFSFYGEGRRAKRGPLCAGIWGGMRTKKAIERLNKINEYGLPFEYIWMDAGWYGKGTKPTPDEFEGDWYMHTGDWQVSTDIHPKKLEDFANAVHDSGKKFLLWFEPERVVKGTPITEEHPEYLLSDGNPENTNLLLNLGNEEAYNYCFNMLSEFIDTLKIDCYRNDFNFSPLEFWRNNDEPERKGITEIKYINALYRLWDSLLEKYPKLVIDNCASGGRRIDIEMLKRSVPLWRSDVMCPANYDVDAVQCNNYAYNLWMPYSGTGSGRIYDEYRIRSAYSAGMTTNYSFSEKEDFCDTEEKVAFLRKYLVEYTALRPFFSEDFYPLTEFSTSSSAWCAMQFNRPRRDDGIIQIFRRENSPYETSVLKLKALDPDADYIVYDVDGGKAKFSGKDLTETGLRVTVKRQRKAKIFRYFKMGREKEEERDINEFAQKLFADLL